MPGAGGFTLCPQTVGPWDAVSRCTRPCTGLAAMAGRERSFAAELPGKEFPETADPIPKDSISRNYPLPPLPSPRCRLPLLFQVSLWLGAMYVETGAEQIHGNVGGWRSVHSARPYLHQVPPIKTLSCSLPCEHQDATRSSETAFGANKNKW